MNIDSEQRTSICKLYHCQPTDEQSICTYAFLDTIPSDEFTSMIFNTSDVYDTMDIIDKKYINKFLEFCGHRFNTDFVLDSVNCEEFMNYVQVRFGIYSEEIVRYVWRKN